MGLEQAVKKEISRFLKEQGCYYHMHVPVGYGMTTIDYLGCYKGLFFGIEAKREKGGRVSCTQKRIIEEIMAAGGSAWIEDSPSLTKTRDMISHLERRATLYSLMCVTKL